MTSQTTAHFATKLSSRPERSVAEGPALMRFVRVSQELIPIRPLVQNPNLDKSEVQVAPAADFLWNLVASVNFMRLSERRTRGSLQHSVAGNQGTLRSG